MATQRKIIFNQQSVSNHIQYPPINLGSQQYNTYAVQHTPVSGSTEKHVIYIGHIYDREINAIQLRGEAWRTSGSAATVSGSINLSIGDFETPTAVVHHNIVSYDSSNPDVFELNLPLGGLGLTHDTVQNIGVSMTASGSYKFAQYGNLSGSATEAQEALPAAYMINPTILISGSAPTLNEVAFAGNNTTKDITANNLIASSNMFCNLSGTGTASITFDGLLGDQLTNDGVNFAMDNFLVVPVSGSTFETALIYNDAQVGGNLEVDGNIISNGLLSTSSSTIYTQVLGPNSDQFHYFYHGNAVGAYMYWDSSEELFAFNKPVKKITTRVTTTYTILIGDDTIFCDTDGGAFTVTLPAGSDGQTFRIINCGTSGNDLTIAPNGAELLTGVNASKTASDGTVIILTYQPTEGWY